MHCSQCGNQLNSDSKFCHKCGKSVEKTEPVKKEADFEVGGFNKTQLIISLIGIMVVVIVLLAFVDANHVSTQNTGTTNNQQQSISDTQASTTNTSVSPLTSSSPSIPNLVSEWSPRVVRIVCVDNNYISTGSGVLTRMNFPNLSISNDSTLITNNHVITDPTTGYTYPSCNFATPGLDNNYINLNMLGVQISSTQDVAYFPSGYMLSAGCPSTKGFSQTTGVSCAQPPSTQATHTLVTNLTAMKVCSSTDAVVGDSIVVLGYPVNGGTGQATTAITATEGIISSYDGEYYVTDAPIDHGNSGGAAILIKDDCYLGIPTWAESGGFGSLGRILSAQYVLGQ